jgi:hypothetical protein
MEVNQPLGDSCCFFVSKGLLVGHLWFKNGLDHLCDQTRDPWDRIAPRRPRRHQFLVGDRRLQSHFCRCKGQRFLLQTRSAKARSPEMCHRNSRRRRGNSSGAPCASSFGGQWIRSFELAGWMTPWPQYIQCFPYVFAASSRHFRSSRFVTIPAELYLSWAYSPPAAVRKAGPCLVQWSGRLRLADQAHHGPVNPNGTPSFAHAASLKQPVFGPRAAQGPITTRTSGTTAIAKTGAF